MVVEIYRCNVCGRTKLINYELIEVHSQDGYTCPNVDDDFNFCKGTLLGTGIFRGSEPLETEIKTVLKTKRDQPIVPRIIPESTDGNNRRTEVK